jgi:curved DNA-binding protein CbpA
LNSASVEPFEHFPPRQRLPLNFFLGIPESLPIFAAHFLQYMSKIEASRKLLNVTSKADLKELKSVYRTIMKAHHPDRFQEEAEKAEAEAKSKRLIDAYHFLVSISPETHAVNIGEYEATIAATILADYQYKGTTLEITYPDGNIYEYFGVPKSVYLKLNNADSQARFVRRSVAKSFVYRKKMSASQD